MVGEEWLRDRTGAWGGSPKESKASGAGETNPEVGPAADIPSTKVLIEGFGLGKHILMVGRTGSGGGPSHRMDTWGRGRGVGKEHVFAGLVVGGACG